VVSHAYARHWKRNIIEGLAEHDEAFKQFLDTTMLTYYTSEKVDLGSDGEEVKQPPRAVRKAGYLEIYCG
jgi:hypothetical protein